MFNLIKAERLSVSLTVTEDGGTWGKGQSKEMGGDNEGKHAENRTADS